MNERIEFIPKAGACLLSRNVISGAARLKYLLRVEPQVAADNGWRFFSEIDDAAYLADPANLAVVDFNDVCALEPVVIGIWDFPVGSDLQIVDDGQRISLVDTASGREIPPEEWFVPPSKRAPEPHRS